MKKLRPLEPSGDLENLQKLAAVHTAKRVEFWKRFLEADVWVVGTSGTPTSMHLHTWKNGDETCAVFTSQALLESAMEPGTPWINLRARVALRIMVAEKLGAFINPRYEFQVRLRAEEVASLLTGRIDGVVGSDA